MDKANGPVMAGYRIKPVNTLSNVTAERSGDGVGRGSHSTR